MRNSKLERTLIKIEKEIEKLKANQQPKEKKMKYYSQIIRVCHLSKSNNRILSFFLSFLFLLFFVGRRLSRRWSLFLDGAHCFD